MTRWDLAILAASATLGLALAWAGDREYVFRFGSFPASEPRESLLPGWLRDRRPEAIRVSEASACILAGLGLGLALATFRPRRGPRPRRRLGPGHVASAVVAVLVVAIAGSQALLPLRQGNLAGSSMVPANGLIPYVTFYRLQHQWRPMVSWAVLGAWACLVVTGWRRRPLDGLDRLGRWLGWGWLALIPGHGVIYILAWS